MRRSRSLRRRITAALAGAILVALLLAALATGIHEYRAVRPRVHTSLKAVAQAAETPIVQAIRNEEPRQVARLGEGLRAGDFLTDAWTESAAGVELGPLQRRPQPRERPAGKTTTRDNLEIDGNRALYAYPLRDLGEVIGVLYVEADITPFRREMNNALLALGVSVVGLLIAVIWTARYLQRELTRPLGALADTVANVQMSGNFSLRARFEIDDEIGELARRINDLFAAVTERDRQIGEANALHNAILQHGGAPIITTLPNGMVQVFNPAAEQLLGYRAQEVVSLVTPLLWHDERELARRARELSIELGRTIGDGFDALIARPAMGQTDVHEWTFIRRDGTRFPVYMAVSALRDPGRRLLGYCALITDLSARREAEDALRSSEIRLRQVLDASPIALALIDSGQRRWLYVNRRFTDWFGYTLADMPTTEHWWNLAYPVPAYREKIRALWRERGLAAGESGELQPLEAEVICHNGKRRLVEFRSQRFGEQSLVAMTDITDRRAQDDALRASEEQFKLLIEQAPDAIIVLDVQADRLIAVNAAAERLFELPRTELMARPFRALSAERQPDGRLSADVVPGIITALLAGETPRFEWLHLTATGREILCEVRLLRLPDPQRLLVRGSLVDLSERRRGEVALRTLTQITAGVAGEAFFTTAVAQLARELHARFALIGELVVADGGLRIRSLGAWRDGAPTSVTFPIVGTPCAELETATGFHHPRDVAEKFPQDPLLRELGAVSYYALPVRDPAGGAVGIVAVADNEPMPDTGAARLLLAAIATRAATELQRLRAEEINRQLHAALEQRVEERTLELRERVADVERLNLDLNRSQDATSQAAARLQEANANLLAANQELEAFSYSVSHDLRAPLRNITGFIELLRKRLAGKTDADGDRFVGIIISEAQRMGRLIDDLLAFSRIGRAELKPAPVQIADLVSEAKLEIQQELAGRQIEWRLAPLPEALGDRTLLRQVVVNLVSNAVKFSQRRESAVIEIGHIPEAAVGSSEVVFFVRDNGAGFNPKYAEKLFRVFQRLHSARDFEGTGIGLANVKRIITRHGGRVWAEGALDAGATFFFTLRRSPTPQ